MSNLWAATASTGLPGSNHNAVPPEQRTFASAMSTCARKAMRNKILEKPLSIYFEALKSIIPGVLFFLIPKPD